MHTNKLILTQVIQHTSDLNPDPASNLLKSSAHQDDSPGNTVTGNFLVFSHVPFFPI